MKWEDMELFLVGIIYIAGLKKNRTAALNKREQIPLSGLLVEFLNKANDRKWVSRWEA